MKLWSASLGHQLGRLTIELSRNVKVYKLYLAALSYDNVFRFNVSMHNKVRV